MDNIIVGNTDDPNYKPVGHLADGTPVFRYNPLPPKKTLVNEKVIEEYNKSVKTADTKTQKLLDQFKWEELKEEERSKLKQQISDGYVETFTETKSSLTNKQKSVWNNIVEANYESPADYTSDIKKLEPKPRKKKPTPAPVKKKLKK